ncbi:hypothetical protein Tco_1545633, partial [Tanacetum coccineum]
MAAGKTNAPDVGVTTAKRTRCGVTVEPNSPFSRLNSGGGVEEEAGQRWWRWCWCDDDGDVDGAVGEEKGRVAK